MNAWHTERVLARAFFGRLFENELMPAVPQAQLVVWCLGALAAPGVMIALRLGGAYKYSAGSSPASLLDTVLRDQLLYVMYSMMVLGLVALLIWENVFPDRRDARLLGVLPISTRAHVSGRVAGLGAFAALFSVSINLPSAVAYGLVLFAYEVAGGAARTVAAHLVATAMAGLFTFFVLILAQGVLLNLLGRTAARRLALVLQSGFVVVLLQALIFVPFIASLIGAAFRTGASSSMAMWLPPAWFLALYDSLAGTRRAVPEVLALAAVLATATVAVIGILSHGTQERRSDVIDDLNECVLWTPVRVVKGEPYCQ